jgi:hypothetical protein
VGENLRNLIRWLSSLHAPLGKWCPLAASALFAVGGLARFSLLRGVAYIGATILGLLIAADLAKSFIDWQSFPEMTNRPRKPLTFLMLAVRVLLSVVLGSFYAFLVFTGIGPWIPLLFLPVSFLMCCLIAWRNVSLWYEQGEVFEEALEESAHQRQRPIPQVFD